MGLSAGKLRGELESLKDFKKRVDGILRTLEDSPASPARVGRQEVPRSAFGGDFAEADGVYAQYNRVHTQLASLSKALGDQIEAMRIAVHGADIGFGNLEDDLKRRFWEIQGRALEHRRQREAEKQEHEGQRPKDEATGATY
ncbi:hypothetical protein F0L17_19585 [Streptomyces sp. TRM43335]|uniref:Uncharacterized protein n=1 Tax=Streptomyces taklimakanensis TaxID=2569853 RepID=A0A6G2BG66_9ACTN|nr:hypothetical protein [Streptomyces taklimakanensis]MTE21277.1 hypothetical protein [Streptomyces taklimakanensis]